MAQINATVTATDEEGQFKLTIDKSEITVPPGKHQIVFELDDQTTNGPTTFDTADPIFHAKGTNCPSSGKSCPELSVDDCTTSLLTLGDNNGGPTIMSYQLNFKYGKKKEHLDPI